MEEVPHRLVNRWNIVVALELYNVLRLLRRLSSPYEYTIGVSTVAARSFYRKLVAVERYAQMALDLALNSATVLRPTFGNHRRDILEAIDRLGVLFALSHSHYVTMVEPGVYQRNLLNFSIHHMLTSRNLFRRLNYVLDRLRRNILTMAVQTLGVDLQAQLTAHMATSSQSTSSRAPGPLSSPAVLAVATPAAHLATNALASNSALFPQLHPLTTTTNVLGTVPVQSAVPVLLPVQPSVVVPSAANALSSLAALVPVAGNATAPVTVVEVPVAVVAANATATHAPPLAVQVQPTFNVAAVNRVLDAFLHSRNM